MSEKVKAAVARMRKRLRESADDMYFRSEEGKELRADYETVTDAAESTLPKAPTIAQAVAFARASIDPSGHMKVLADTAEWAMLPPLFRHPGHPGAVNYGTSPSVTVCRGVPFTVVNRIDRVEPTVFPGFHTYAEPIAESNEPAKPEPNDHVVIGAYRGTGRAFTPYDGDLPTTKANAERKAEKWMLMHPNATYSAVKVPT